MFHSSSGKAISAVLLTLGLACDREGDTTRGDGIGQGPADPAAQDRADQPTVNDGSHPSPPAYAVSDPGAPMGGSTSASIGSADSGGPGSGARAGSGGEAGSGEPATGTGGQPAPPR